MITDKSLEAAANAFTDAENQKGIVSLGDKLKAAILAYIQTPTGAHPCNQPIAYLECKGLLERGGFDMVMVIATSETDIIGSSYGKTDHDYNVANAMLKSIMDKIESKQI